MTFLQPWWLLLAPVGTVIVVLLHLQRRREVEIGSTYLWRRVAMGGDANSSAKLPSVRLPLVLQLLCVLLGVSALAGPRLELDGAVEHTVFVVDNSLSMSAEDVRPSRFLEARAAASRVIDDAVRGDDSGSRVSVVSAGEPTHVVVARSRIHSGLPDLVDDLRPTHGLIDWAEARDVVQSLLADGEATRVEVLSDSAPDVDWLEDDDVDVGWRPVGASSRNAALVDVSVRPAIRAGENWSIQGSVHSDGAEDQSLPVVLTFRPAEVDEPLEWARRTVDIGPNGVGTFSFEVEAPDAGFLGVSIDEGGGALTADDQVTFVTHGGPWTIDVLHVGPDNAPLHQALNAVDGVNVFRAPSLPSDASEFDLVVVDRVSVAEHPGTATLWLGSPPMPTGQEEQSYLAEASPTGWLREHPLSREVSWSDLEVESAFDARTLDGATVLVEAGGAALVQARTTTVGREVVLAFALEASNWPAQVAFPTFIARLLTWIEPHVGQRVVEPCHVGHSCPLGAGALAGDSRIIEPDGREVMLGLVGADGVHASEPEFVPRLAGVHTLVGGSNRRPLSVVAAERPSPGLPTAQADRSPEGLTLAQTVPNVARRAFLLALVVIVAFEAWISRGTYGLWTGRSVGVPSMRRRGLGMLRLASTALFLIALADVPLPSVHRDAGAVVLVDQHALRSDGSIGAVETLLQRGGDEAGRARKLGVVMVDDSPHVVQELGERSTPHWGLMAASTAPNALAAGLDLAAGMLTGPGPKRIVLATDGTVLPGDINPDLQHLMGRGVALDVLGLPMLSDGEVLVESVDAPARVHVGDVISVEANVYAHTSVDARIRAFKGDEALIDRSVRLESGRSRIAVTTSHDAPGDVVYRFEVEAPEDVVAANNGDGTVVQVRPPSRIVVFAAQEEWGESFIEALRIQGIEAELFGPESIPFYLGHEQENVRGWLDYDVAVLMNVPALELRTQQQEILETWIREHGGGLILLGGENTFGPGGYYGSIMEDVLPLSTEIPQELPRVAISFVLDRSGSMRQAVGESTRLEVAKRATLGAVELLDEESSVGVVAFDSEAHELVPLMAAGDIEGFASLLEPLRSGGGTSIHPGLELALEQLSTVDPEITRHVVLMTDGLSQPGEFEPLLDRFSSEGITVSTAAIGRGADATLLRNIARWGSGSAHVTEDFEAFPSILAQEALMLSDEPVQRSTFRPTWVSTDVAFLEGAPAEPPRLHGHVLTTEKQGAAVHLVGPEGTPLLASWRYGLGRVVGFASHGAGPWAADWMAMDEYPRLWAQAVRWAQPVTDGPGTRLSVRRIGHEGVVTVEATAADGEPVDTRRLDVSVRSDDGESAVDMIPTSFGRSIGRFEIAKEGLLEIAVVPASDANDGADADGSPQEGDVLGTVPLYVGYDARDRPTRDGMDSWRAVSAATGGRALSVGDRVFAEDPAQLWRTESAWRLWAIVGLGILIGELIARYAPGRFRRRIPET